MPPQKVAIVTGAAGGIGKVLSKRLLERNYRVVLADINTIAGEKAQEEFGKNTLFVRTDVADYESTAAMFRKAFEWGGRIDFFAANAGIEESESIYVLPPADKEPPKPNLKIIDVDCLSVIYGLRLFRWYVRKSNTGEGGRMVVTASQAALYPMYVAPVYCAAKSAVVGLVRATGMKLRDDENITLNAICPGPVNTGISPDMVKVVPLEKMTPVKLVIDAFEKFIDDDSLSGEICETSNENMYFREHLEYSDDIAKQLNKDMLNAAMMKSFYERGATH